MKAEDVGNLSDALFFIEQLGASKLDAKTVVLKIYYAGMGACLDQLRDDRPFPADLSHLVAQASPAAEIELPKGKKAPKKALHRIPSDMILTDELRQFAKERAFSANEIESMWVKFFNHYLANGDTAVDWKAKWRTWVMRGVDYKIRDNSRGPNAPQPDRRMI